MSCKLLTWTDELCASSGLALAAVTRGRAVLDVMRTELMAGQYLDLLEQAAGTGTVAEALAAPVTPEARAALAELAIAATARAG